MALSANASYPMRNIAGQTRLSAVVLTSNILYHHALAVRTAAGKARTAANATTTTFLGLVVIDNPDDATAGITGDGTLRAECIANVDVQLPLATVVTVGDVGETMYAVDDAAVTTSNTLGPVVGTLVEFTSANLGWVRITLGGARAS